MRAVLSFGAIALLCALPRVATSQVIPDASLGTQVGTSGDTVEIYDGTRSGDGANLFHSFESFDISGGQTASFLTTPDVQNVLGRVVGGGASAIDGLLQVAGSDASLFLMNPAGIVFGEGARLDVAGDFTATTASGIGFADGWFAASGLAGDAGFVGAPIAFDFSGASGLASGAIVNLGELSAGDSVNLLGGTVVHGGTLAGSAIRVVAVEAGNVLRLDVPGSVLGLEVETGRAIASGIEAVALPELLTGGDLASATTLTTIDGVVRLSGATIEPGDVAIVGDGAATIAPGEIVLAATNDIELAADLDAGAGAGSVVAISNLDAANGGTFANAGDRAIAPGRNLEIEFRADAPRGLQQRTRQRSPWLGSLTEAVTETVGETTEAVSETATETATETTEAATETVSETTEAVSETATETATETVGETTETVAEVATETTEAVTEPVSEATEPVTEAVTETIGATTEAVGETTAAVTETVSETVTETTETVTESVGATTEAVAEAVAGTTETVATVTEGVGEVTETVSGAVSEAISGAIAAVEETASEVVSGVGETIGDVGDAVSDVASGVVAAAPIEAPVGEVVETTGEIIAAAPVDEVVGEIGDATIDDISGDMTTAAGGDLVSVLPEPGAVAVTGGASGGDVSVGGTVTVGIIEAVGPDPRDSGDPATLSTPSADDFASSSSGLDAPLEFDTGSTFEIAASAPILDVGDLVTNVAIDLATEAAIGESLASPATLSVENFAPPATLDRASIVTFVQADSTLNPNITLAQMSRDPQLDRADSADVLSRDLLEFQAENITPNVLSFASPNPRDLLDLDTERSLEYTRYFGDESEFDGSIEALREAMANVEAATGVRTGVSYVSLRADAIDIALLVAEGEPLTITVPVDRDVLLATVDRYRRALIDTRTRRTNRHNEYAAQLYDWLIRPIAADLETREIDTLMFSLDAGLRGLPIAALYDGDRYLAERYSLSLIPSIGLLDTRYRPLAADAPVLAAGASTFADLVALPAVPAELSALHQRRGGGLLLDRDFTRANLVAARDRNAHPIVHLATHGEFNAGRLSDSYIQLWDERIGLDSIRELGWHDPTLELLVLSACRTALGSDAAEMGFAGLAVATGVKTAIASLWSVDDAATYVLMGELYDSLTSAPIKAEAVRAAQLAFIEGRARIEDGLLYAGNGAAPIPLPDELGARPDRDFSHPYYWAGFTAIGSPW